MIEALLSIKIPHIWVCTITEKYPLRLRFLSCMPFETGGRAVIEILGEEEVLEKAIGEIPATMIIDQSREGKRVVSCEGSPDDIEVCKHLIKSGCFLVTPFGGENGYMDWLLVTDRNDSLSSLLENLRGTGCEVKVKRIADLKEKRILTDRQEDIIRFGLEHGYFEFPKRIGIRKIAETFEISIATVSEIMRSAQQKILGQYFER